MPGQLYARYVPPKKSTKPAQELPASAVQHGTVQQDGLYARYIPLKKSKPSVDEQPLVRQDDLHEGGEAYSGDVIPNDGASGGKKRKRAGQEKKTGIKKEKSHKRQSVVSVPRDTERAIHSPPKEITIVDGKPAPEPTERIPRFDQMNTDPEQQVVKEPQLDANSILAKYSVTNGAKQKAQTAERQSVDVGEGTHDEYDAAAGAQAVFAKYKKSLTLSEKRQKKQQSQDQPDEPTQEQELHDLVPLPQPEKTPRVPYRPNFSSLPDWIRHQRSVWSDETLPFSDLNLSPKLSENLKKRDLSRALAVQTAVLPLLLPGRENYRGDICISAPTGSGKTLSYVLPMVEGMQSKALTRLRGLIVVPTRELVAQVREAAEICAVGTGVKLGTAVGSVALAVEQEQLIKRSQRYDAEAAAELMKEAEEKFELGYGLDDELLSVIPDLLPKHVPDYSSNVDILICTPGRLVDHIKSTTGFSLQHVEWLVIDEADRLLDQNFQGWVDTVLPGLESTGNTAREQVLSTMKTGAPPRRVQKVILSATMTRDLSKLASLRLSKPTLVAVREREKEEDGKEETKPADSHAAILPTSLTEGAIPVGDGSEKPLYLLQLLKERLGISPTSEQTVLIFCASDDNATRLSRLLPFLSPDLEKLVATVTKSTTASERRKTLKDLNKSGHLRILISTDRTSRGLDVQDLAYVVNYDIPPSVTSYIHRVGRTARAGKDGQAWTLYTDTEARWFWKSVANGGDIRRGDRMVERVRLGDPKDIEVAREKYRKALGELSEAVRAK